MALASSPLLSTNVAVSLYNSLKEGLGKSENIFFSPFSIAVALSMVKHGARGESLQQLHNLLSKSDVAEAKKAMVTIKSTSDSSFKVTTANRAWVQKSYDIVQEYIDFLKNEFGSSIISADFITDSAAVAGEINSWVESETNDKIKNLLTPDSLNALTRLVLVNAVYFKGTWVEQFSKEDTMPRDFHLNKSEKIQTDFMYQEEYMRYGKLDKCTVVGLPYTAPKNMSAHMYVIVPNEIEGLEQVEGDLEKILPKLDSLKREKVKLYLPKFKFEQKTDLVECLKRLGVSHLFDASLCDISGINKELFVSKVIHKAVVEVDEEGTVAAAATAAIAMMRSMPLPKPLIEVNRPYIFLIKLNEQTLFMGRATNPTIAS